MKELRNRDTVYLVDRYYHGNSAQFGTLAYHWNDGTKKLFSHLTADVDYFDNEQEGKEEVERRYRDKKCILLRV